MDDLAEIVQQGEASHNGYLGYSGEEEVKGELLRTRSSVEQLVLVTWSDEDVEDEEERHKNMRDWECL